MSAAKPAPPPNRGDKARALDADVDLVAEDGDAGVALDAFLRARLATSWGAVRTLVERGKVSVDGARVTEARTPLRKGSRIEIRPRASRLVRPHESVLDDAQIAFFDAHIVVVRKPSGISTIPYEAGERGTLEEKARNWLVKRAKHAANASLGVVHRIDKETSGLVVFTRTFAAKKVLGAAFRAHTIDRRYVAIAHGLITAKRTFRSYIIEDRGDGLRGSPKDQTLGERIGQLAITHAAPMTTLGDGGSSATLIACALETGRTHQIRIHLSEAGHAIVGDRVYTRDRIRDLQHLIEAPRLMLHATVLGFDHPITGKPVRFTEPPPADFLAMAKKLARREIKVDPEALPL